MTSSDYDLNNLPGLQFLDLSAKILFRLSEALLQTSQKLIFFPLRERKIVIRQLAILLFQFPLHFVPTALDLKFGCHSKGITPFTGCLVVRSIQKAPRTRTMQPRSFGLPATRRQSAFTEPSQVSPHYQFQSKRGNRFLANVRDCFFHGIGRENQIEIGSVDHPLACHFLKHL